MGKEYISTWQLACLTLGFTLGSSMIFKSGVEYGGRMTWVSEAVSAVLGILIIIMIHAIIKKHPGQNLLQILTALLGSWGAKLLLLFYIFFATMLAAFVVSVLKDLFAIAIMTETPGWIFCLTLVFAAGYVIRHGLEVTARCSEIMISLSVPVLGLLFLAALSFLNPDNLRPVFSISFFDFTRTLILTTASPCSELFLLTSLAVHLKKPSQALLGMLAGYILGSFFLIVRPILTVGIFSVQEAADLVYPTYMVARIIRYGLYLERLEMLLVFAWFFVVFIKLAVCILAALKETGSLFKQKDYKRFAYPFCILLVPLSINAFSAFYEVSEFVTLILPLLVLPFSFMVLPLLAFLAVIKQGSEQKSRE